MASESANEEAASPPKLKPAEHELLVSGETVYIRGEKAKVDHLEWPLVFFQFDNEPGVTKHRPFTVRPEMFQVPFDREPVPIEEVQESSSDSDSSDEEKGEAEDLAEPNMASASIIQLRRRAERVHIEGKNGVVFVSEAKMPQGVFVTACANAFIDIVHKVSSIEINKCSNLTLRFHSVIANVTIFGCSDVQVSASHGCPTYQIEDSHDCSVEFLQSEQPIFVTLRSTASLRACTAEQLQDVNASESVCETDVQETDAQVTTNWDGTSFASAPLTRCGIHPVVANKTVTKPPVQ